MVIFDVFSFFEADILSFHLFQVSVTSGAILAGASEEDIKQCEIFATKIGLAFQSKCLT